MNKKVIKKNTGNVLARNSSFGGPLLRKQQKGWKIRNSEYRFKAFKQKFKTGSNNRYSNNRYPRRFVGWRQTPRLRNAKNNFFFKKTSRKNYNFRKKDYPFKELFLKNFAAQTYHFFKKDVGRDKKLAMTNYWKVFKDYIDPNFSFSYPHLDRQFYLGVVRSCIGAIMGFIGSFFKGAMLASRSDNVHIKSICKALHHVHAVIALIKHLANIYERPFRKPDYYFRGYRTVLRMSFFRHLTIFCMKIFILANRAFLPSSKMIKDHSSFFLLWKNVYKGWLNKYYEKVTSKRKVECMRSSTYATSQLLRYHLARKNRWFWVKLLKFRRNWTGYKRVLLNYLFAYSETNYKSDRPFSFSRRKYRFKYNIFGKRVYLQRKASFKRKSRKYIRWFRNLVTGGHYFSPSYAKKTFFRGGYGRRAWISRRRARNVFKMKFVFIRYFSKKFGLKNKTAFLRKAEHVVRKRGDKWLRYYREFESRLLRVLVLFGFSNNDRMSKSLISGNGVVVNRKIVNDHDYKSIPRVKAGDLISLSNFAVPYFIKKKIKFFNKRLRFFARTEEAKVTYSLFKKYFSEWMLPSVYYINGPIIKHGLSALMSGQVVKHSKVYYSINKFIPFFNRGLFKIFVQRFSKKLN